MITDEVKDKPKVVPHPIPMNKTVYIKLYEVRRHTQNVSKIHHNSKEYQGVRTWDCLI